MAITVKPLADSSKDNLLQAVRQVFLDLEDQLNAKAQIYSNTTGLVPDGLVIGDILVASLKGKISIRVKNSRGFDSLTAEMIQGLGSHGMVFKGVQENAQPITIGNFASIFFPDANDFGFYHDTTLGRYYLCWGLGSNTFVNIRLT